MAKVKVKITPNGMGYVYGDGDLPQGFDADKMLKHIARRMADKQYDALDEEFEIEDDERVEIEEKIAAEQAAITEIDETQTLELDCELTQEDLEALI